MKLKTLAIAAVITGFSTAAFATSGAGYHPGYSSSDLKRAERENRAAADGPVIGTRGSGYMVDQEQAPTSSGAYTPGYSDSDIRQMERTSNSSHTLPHTQATPGTPFISEP